MINFTRNQTPECLEHAPKNKENNYIRWAKSWCAKLRKTPTTNSFSWHTYKNEKVDQILLEQLRILTNNHCSFCDKYAPEEDSDSIEHFYPKKLFCSKAFTWSNLFLCCTGCQKSPKGWKKRESTDRKKILKPDHPDYSFDKFFIFNTKNGNIDVVAFPKNRTV